MSASGSSGAGGQRRGTIEGDMVPCWLCYQSVSLRALFCHACGAIQPPRGLDHFTRLGLERRFDLDLAVLEKQFQGFKRYLDPDRFVNRGAGEKLHAQNQAEAFDAAYDTLKNPLSRARYLLSLSSVPNLVTTATLADDAELAAEITGLLRDFDAAVDTVALDRFANQAARDIEANIRGLSAAFRAGQLAEAARTVVRLDHLTDLAASARRRRAALQS